MGSLAEPGHSVLLHSGGFPCVLFCTPMSPKGTHVIFRTIWSFLPLFFLCKYKKLMEA